MSLLQPRRRRQVEETLPSWVRAWFLDGEAPVRDTPEFHDYVQMRFLGGPDAERQLWELWRGELLAFWLEKHSGTRPPGWWRFEAKEPLRVLPGQVVEVSDTPWTDDGMPYVFPEGPELTFTGRLKVESQAAHLRRLKLLLPGEAKRIPRTAFRPDVVDFD